MKAHADQRRRQSQHGDKQVCSSVRDHKIVRHLAESGSRTEERPADHVGDYGREDHRDKSIEGELPQDEFAAEQHAGHRRVERSADTRGGPARDKDPQPGAGQPGELAKARRQRRSDLHDRPLPAHRPAETDAQRRRERLDHTHLRADLPALRGYGIHHLRHAMPACLPSEPVDQRAVQQAARDWGHDQEPQAKPRQVGTADPA